MLTEVKEMRKEEFTGMGEYFRYMRSGYYPVGDKNFREAPENWTLVKFFYGW